MKKLICIVGLLLITISMKAHQPNSSTTMLVENENNTWALQISASLTAFQQEIKMHFSETPYKTPEEFQQMVIEYVKKNFEMTFNGTDSITFGKGIVRLGHETKVVFEVFGVPEQINSVIARNEIFKDIHRNQSALLILKEGFKREQFLLNNTNNHKVELVVNENKFELKKEAVNASSQNVLIVLMLILGVSFLFHLVTGDRFSIKSLKK